MKRNKVSRLAAVFLLSILITTCKSVQTRQLSGEEEAAIAETLLSLTKDYNSEWEKLDLKEISKYHADDFTYYRRGVVQSTSQKEFEQAYKDDVAKQITSYWANAKNISVEVLGPDAGMVAFVFRGNVVTLDGAKLDYDGALTYVYERRGGRWRIVHIHESAYLPKSEQ